MSAKRTGSLDSRHTRFDWIPASGTVPPLADVNGLLVKEISASGGRFLELSIEFDAPWVSPDDPALTASTALNAQDVLVAIEALQGWLTTLGFAA